MAIVDEDLAQARGLPNKTYVEIQGQETDPQVIDPSDPLKTRVRILKGANVPQPLAARVSFGPRSGSRPAPVAPKRSPREVITDAIDEGEETMEKTGKRLAALREALEDMDARTDAAAAGIALVPQLDAEHEEPGDDGVITFDAEHEVIDAEHEIIDAEAVTPPAAELGELGDGTDED